LSRELLPPADLSVSKMGRQARGTALRPETWSGSAAGVAQVFEALPRDTRYSIAVIPS